MSKFKPPLRARLHWYLLSTDEFALLTSMCEHCSDGSSIWAAIPRLAAFAKLSERTVQRLIRKFCEHGVLSQLAPANATKHRPATYQINESVLEDDPKMAPYRKRGAPTLNTSGDHLGETPAHLRLVPAGQQTGVPHPGSPVSTRHQSSVSESHDSKALDPKTLHSKTLTHHGDAEINALPAWLAFKEQLRNELPKEEWNLWVRPMYLLRIMGVGPGQKQFIAAIPRNGRIRTTAQNRLPMMRELLGPSGINISLTNHPDEWEINEVKKRYDIDVRPKPWTRKEA